MALVRKTTKLQDSIVEQLDEVRTKKALSLIQSFKVDEMINTFIQTTYDEGLIVPNSDKEWAMGHSRAEVGDYLGYQALDTECIIQWPMPEHNFAQMVCHPTDNDFVFPVFENPRYLFRDEQGTTLVGLAAKEDYTHVHPDNRFRLVFNIPRLVCGDTPQEDKTILYYYQHDPTEPSDMGRYQNAMASMQYDRITPMTLSLDNPNEIYSPKLQELYQEFVNLHTNIIGSLARIDKSQQYIFGELWKLPSLNKMREFFPAIIAFIPQEVLDKLNQGASKRKKEYNISLPDSDVIVSATEASIKS
jgi:hypothetical protein